ncbi:mRNA interferase PemK [Mannheimia haemolytica]|uniref:mRNA interferase PemK n=2 Tax=Mannheimia TaxID=75984 RepID=A0A448T6U8_MANHA|nr:type II toxin-antitoxin system PemK/MazF family toxin [Mannheimia haemolytica]STY62127.1 mRNA interferase PemK [Mannheimia haemolytica]VEI75726.1 mRNA interferase PemK [Mannheimia haemolytica]
MVRGDIYLVNLDPTIGSEIQKTRPCVIISPPEIHDYLRTALIAPMTTGSRPAPFRIPVDFQGKSGLILPEQIRVVDKARLVKKVGELETETLHKLLGILQEMFAE